MVFLKTENCFSRNSIFCYKYHWAKLIMINLWKITSSSVLRQYLAGGSCCISMAIVGVFIGWTSSAIPKLKNNEALIRPDNSQITWIVSAIHIGNLVSTIPGSYLMDKLGRKSTLLYSALFPTSAWVIMYFATEAYHVYFARFLCGLSLGCNYMITPVYISEISEPKVRGSIGNIMAVMLNFGVLYEFIIGPYVSYNTLLFLSMLVPITFLITFVWMPESPYYYVLKNQNDKAIKSLIWLRYDKTEDDIINELNTIDSSTKEQMESKASYKNLISTTGNRKALIMSLMTAVFQRASGMGPLMQYASITLPINSVSWLTLNQCMTILSIFWFFTNFSSTFIIDNFNRKTLLCLSSFGCGLTTLTASLWFYCKKYTVFDTITGLTWLPFISFLFHAEFYALGLGPIGGSIRGELFSAQAKSRASALTQIVSAVFSFMLTKVYLYVDDYFGMYMNYLFFGVCCFISVLFIVFYLIETKGKSLQMIQDELNGVRPQKLRRKL